MLLPFLWKTYKPVRSVMLSGDAQMGKDVNDVKIVAATAGAALV